MDGEDFIKNKCEEMMIIFLIRLRGLAADC